MKTVGAVLLALALLAGAFAGGWAVARGQGQRALVELRGQVDSLHGQLLPQVGRTEATAAAVTPWIDSVGVLLARLQARPARPQSTPGAPSATPEAPGALHDGPEAVPLPVAVADTADLVAPLAEACGQLATHCAALRDSVVDLGRQVRRQATRIDSLLAAPAAPPAPKLEIHAGGFRTGLAIGAAGTALLVLTIALLAGH